jgi:hypothetical protein
MVNNASRPGAVAMAFVLYVAISVGVFGVLVVGSPARIYIGYDTDPSVMMWFLTWWPHALTHNLNPFLTKVIWAPIGYNLAWATSMPGPSLLAYPITRRFGPVVSYNLLCLMAPALNATAAFLLCTRLSRRFLVALTGGYIFGFSPFVLVHQLAGHLFLIFVPWVPLLLYLALHFIERNMRSWHAIGLFALLATAQCLTATETFMTAAMIGTLTIIVATLILPADFRPMMARLFKVLCVSALVTTVLISPYIYYAIAYREQLIAGGSFLNSGLGALFVPPPNLLVSYPQILAAAHGRSAGLLGDRSVFYARFYLGPFFLFVLLYSAVKQWNSPAVRMLLVTGAAAWLLSLGAYRQIGHYRILLPWALFWKLPFVGQALPARLAMYCYLNLAMLTVLFLDRLKANWQRTLGVLLSVLFILPAVPATERAVTAVDTPEFFGTPLFTRYLDRDELVLVLPNSSDGNSMLWQAQTGMYFRMAGGYIGGIPPGFAIEEIRELFRPGQITLARGDRLKAFLTTYGIRSVIVNANISSGWSDLSSVLGTSPVRVGGVLLYQHDSKSYAARVTTPMTAIVKFDGGL